MSGCSVLETVKMTVQIDIIWIYGAPIRTRIHIFRVTTPVRWIRYVADQRST